MVTLPPWPVSTDFGTCLYQCFIIIIIIIIIIIVVISTRDALITVTTSPVRLNFVLWRLVFVVSHFGTGAKNCKVASTPLAYMWTRYFDDMEEMDVSIAVMLTCR